MLTLAEGEHEERAELSVGPSAHRRSRRVKRRVGEQVVEQIAQQRERCDVRAMQVVNHERGGGARGQL